MRLILALLSAAIAAQAQAPYVPTDVLSRAQAVRDSAAKAAGKLWPGWDPASTPLGVYRHGEFLAVLGAKQLPPPFKMDPASSPNDPLFIAPAAGMHFSDGVGRIGNVTIAEISADELAAKSNDEAAADYGVRALFLAYIHQVAPKKTPDLTVLLWGKYPDFATRNRVLMQMEADSLLDAVRAPDDDQCKKHVGEFLGARAERRKYMEADVAKFESAEESTLGLAEYVAYRLTEHPEKLAELGKIRELPREREQERFELLGMAEALVLDRLRPAWKKEFESSDATPDELLERVTTASPELREWGQALPEEQAKVRKWEDEGSRRIGLMLAQKAKKVVIEVGAARSKLRLRALNPSMMVPLTPNYTAFTMLALDLDDMKLDFAGVPVVYEKQQDAFWCMLPEDVVDAAIKDMGDKLKITGRGFTLEFENFQVSQRGKELRIHSALILEKQGPLKPEFVKPKTDPPLEWLPRS